MRVLWALSNTAIDLRVQPKLNLCHDWTDGSFKPECDGGSLFWTVQRSTAARCDATKPFKTSRISKQEERELVNLKLSECDSERIHITS